MGLVKVLVRKRQQDELFKSPLIRGDLEGSLQSEYWVKCAGCIIDW
jgi:hypothetical protein